MDAMQGQDGVTDGHAAMAGHNRALTPPRQVEWTHALMVPSATMARTIYTPAAALLVTRELQQYPSPKAERGPWLAWITHLLGIVGQPRSRSWTPSRQRPERSRMPEHTPPPPRP